MVVRFEHGLTDHDYLIEIDAGMDAHVRIEVLRPSGLVRLLPAGADGASDPALLDGVRDYWRRNYHPGTQQ